MKRLTIFCAAIFLFGLAVSTVAAQDGYHHGMGYGKDKSPHGMMMRGDGMCQMMGEACPMCGMGMRRGMGMMDGPMAGMHGMMMGGMGMMDGPMAGMHGMMMGGKAPSFYLDKKEKLGLDQQQIQQLRDIRRDFRKNFVRQSAEMKIAKMDLEDAFQEDWTVENAEKQLRQIQQLRTDLVVRYLKARKQAEQVLTAEQLQMVRGEMDQ